MPLLGAHMSIAGGVHMAFVRLRRIRGQALQIFTRNQIQWRAPPIHPEQAELFRVEWEKSGKPPVAAHDSYLVNLASADSAIRERSVEAFAEEIRRCALLGIPFLVTHPGSHAGGDRTEGLRLYVSHLDRAIYLSGEPGVAVLVETTAGQGSRLGSSLDEIALILELSRFGERLGVCFDTCHAFAAGLDMRTADTYEETMGLFERSIGLGRLKLFHLNDSKRGIGSRVDRHEHIGKGQIGLEGFRCLLNDPRFRHHPMILETPKGKTLAQDRRNLRVLRSLIASD
jgi:deoxyribonuclease-4